MGQYTSALTASHNKFASSLFKSIQEKNSQHANVIFSPISIFMAMLMATSGSNGETLIELGRGLCIDQCPSTVEVFRQIIEPFTTNFFENLNTSILNVANNAFIDVHAVLSEQFKEHVEKAFHVKVSQCDFVGNPQLEAENINQWISSHTNQKIKNIVHHSQFTLLTRLLLINVVHFCGQWKNVFDINETHTSPFFGINGETTCALMQKKSSKEQYGTEDLYHWVTMPFNDSKYKMTIIAVKSNTHELAFNDWFSKKLSHGFEAAFPTRETPMKTVAFPIFEIEQTMALNEILYGAPFNIQRSFSENADFSNLITDDKIHIDAILHKAYFKVNETGVEAGAAGRVDFAVFGQKPDFIVTSPFAFILTDDYSKTIIFTGKVNNL